MLGKKFQRSQSTPDMSIQRFDSVGSVKIFSNDTNFYYEKSKGFELELEVLINCNDRKKLVDLLKKGPVVNYYKRDIRKITDIWLSDDENISDDKKLKKLDENFKVKAREILSGNHVESKALVFFFLRFNKYKLKKGGKNGLNEQVQKNAYDIIAESKDGHINKKTVLWNALLNIKSKLADVLAERRARFIEKNGELKKQQDELKNKQDQLKGFVESLRSYKTDLLVRVSDFDVEFDKTRPGAWSSEFEKALGWIEVYMALTNNEFEWIPYRGYGIYIGPFYDECNKKCEKIIEEKNIEVLKIRESYESTIHAIEDTLALLTAPGLNSFDKLKCAFDEVKETFDALPTIKHVIESYRKELNDLSKEKFSDLIDIVEKSIIPKYKELQKNIDSFTQNQLDELVPEEYDIIHFNDISEVPDWCKIEQPSSYSELSQSEQVNDKEDKNNAVEKNKSEKEDTKNDVSENNKHEKMDAKEPETKIETNTKNMNNVNDKNNSSSKVADQNNLEKNDKEQKNNPKENTKFEKMSDDELWQEISKNKQGEVPKNFKSNMYVKRFKITMDELSTKLKEEKNVNKRKAMQQLLINMLENL